MACLLVLLRPRHTLVYHQCPGDLVPYATIETRGTVADPVLTRRLCLLTPYSLCQARWPRPQSGPTTSDRAVSPRTPLKLLA